MRLLKNILFKIITNILFHTRAAVYLLLGFIDTYITKTQTKIVVFSYHSISQDDWRFSVDEAIVKKQLLYLKKHFSIVSLSTLYDHIQGKKRITKPSAVICFDDGYKDILTIKAFCKKHSIIPSVFLLANTKNPNLKELGTKREFLTNTEIKALRKDGWEIGCHSATHANLAEISTKELKEEIIESKKKLEKALRIKINFFAYPRGKYNAKVIANIKKAGYKAAFTMDDGEIKQGIDLYTIPRIGIDRSHTFKEFVSTFSPSVIKFRQIIKTSPAGRYI